MDIRETFLATLSDTCFPKKLGQEDSRERLFFLARFHPDNEQKKYIKIAEEITDQNWGKSVTTTASKVMYQLVHSYDEEMKTDQVDTEKLLNREQGERGA